MTDTLPTPTERAEYEAERDRARRKTYEDAVPATFRAARVADLSRIDQNGRHIEHWLQGPHRTLLLLGGRGVGKTHAGYAVLHAAAEAGQVVYGATVAGLLDSLAPAPAVQSPAGRLAIDADVFLFDAFNTSLAGPHAPTVSSWASNRLAGILEHRTREGRRQIITTSDSPEQLRAKFGPQVWDLMSAGALILHFSSASSLR